MFTTLLLGCHDFSFSEKIIIEFKIETHHTSLSQSQTSYIDYNDITYSSTEIYLPYPGIIYIYILSAE